VTSPAPPDGTNDTAILPKSPDDGNGIISSPESPAASDGQVEEWIIDLINILTKCATALQPFTLLRNVSRVEICGVVRPHYKQYLIDTMQGNSPLDHLPRMYDGLQHYAGHSDCVEDELQEACEAIEGDDVEGFKLIRAEVVKKLTAFMADARERLFDHDARLD
jgi:hypothetical protein